MSDIQTRYKRSLTGSNRWMKKEKRMTPKMNEDIIYFDDIMPQNKYDDLIWVAGTETMTSTSYVINLDKDVTEPHHYRQIVKTVLEMGENDIANWNINTYGGDLYTTIMLIDAIRQSQGYHYGIVTLGSSAGSFIALALNDCEVIPYGGMFIHEVQSGNYGSNSSQEKQLIYMKEKQKKFIEDIYADFLTQDEMNRIQNNEELWLSDKECNIRLENRRKIRHERFEKEQQEMREKAEQENKPKTKKEKIEKGV